MEANAISDPRLIRVGQTLLILLGAPATPATPVFPYAAPDLLSPPEGELLFYPEDVVMLNWTSVGTLAKDEYYVVSLRYLAPGASQPPSHWTKTQNYRVPDDLYPPKESDYHDFEWEVTVMRQTGTKPDGTLEGVPISPPSETRRFSWY